MGAVKSPRERVLNFIRDFVASEGYPPTYREIAAGCGFASANTAWVHVQRLADDGRLKLDRRRKIVVLEHSPTSV